MANNYCALYRKYRPEKLDDVVGQEVIVKTLKNAIKKNFISHAYLFTGPRGTGKTSIAKILAKTINCMNLDDTNPCDKCVSCTQINLKQNVDIIEIDAASNNGVDEIREIRSKVNLVPSISKYKVYIIDEVHMLTTGAFNALLKTLEEPPTHIIFILATTEPHKIPITILSRCQRYDFKRISQAAIIDRLNYICKMEKIDITSDAIEQIAFSSDGGMRDAISTLDQVIAYANDKIDLQDVHDIVGTIGVAEMDDFVSLIFNNNINEVMNKLNNYNDNGKNLVKICEELIEFLKNIILCKEAPDYFENSNYFRDIYKKYTYLDNNKLIEYIDLICNSIGEIRKSNMPKFLFEMMLIKLLGTCLNDQNDEKKVIYSQKNNECVEKKENANFSVNSVKTKSQNNNVSNTSNDEFLKLKDVRISNTLSKFNKSFMVEIRNNLKDLSGLLINPDISQVVSIVLDGVIKAASDEYIVFVYENENNANLFNDNISDIENILESLLNKKYKVIATDLSSWNIIKDDFNNRKKVFNYVTEENMFQKCGKIEVESKDNSEIDDLFGSAVEYEN